MIDERNLAVEVSSDILAPILFGHTEQITFILRSIKTNKIPTPGHSPSPACSLTIFMLRTHQAQGPSPAQARFGKSGNQEIQKFGIQQIEQIMKFSKSKSPLPKMSARSGSVGKKSSWPHLGPSQAIFSMDKKSQKTSVLFSNFF